MSNFSPIVPPKHAEHWVYEAFRSISTQLGQHALDLSAIGRGESPDGSGMPILDLEQFFLLAGRNSGQTGYGGSGPGQNLILSSTRSGTKSFIYLGTVANARVAYDEVNNFFGIGIDVPTAQLHLNLSSVGTSGNATFGTHFFDVTVGQTGYIFSSAVYQNGSGTDWAFVIGGTNPGVGVGSVLFMNQARTVSWRLAMGTYGSDTIKYVHHQHGALDTSSPYTTVNNNALFLGFNDNCGLYETHHFRHFNVWAEGDNLVGSSIAGKTVTNANMALVGFNSPTAQRTGTTNYDDQPVVTIGGGTWFQTYHGVTLRVTSGSTFAGSGGVEGAAAKQEIFQIREGGSLSSGSNMMFAVDQFARLKMYNTGSGTLSSSISARRSEFLLEDGITGASTPSCHVEFVSTNAWADTSVAYQMRIGYDDTQVAIGLRNVIVGASLRAGGDVQPGILNRYAVRTSAFYVSDGTFTVASGQVGAPLGLMNIFNFVNNATVLLALKRKSGQTGDLTDWFDSDGTTKLAFIDKDGNATFTSVASTGASSFSDALFTLFDDATPTKKLAWQLSGITAATTRTLTVQDADGTIPLLQFANLFTTTQDITPATDVTGLTLHCPNGSGVLKNTLESHDISGLLMFAVRQTGRVQIGLTDTTTDAIVRLSLNCTPTQSVNLIQCTDGTDTLFSVGSRGAFVFGANSTAMDAVIRFQVNFSSTQSSNVMTFVRGGVTIVRMQSNGNLLVGGSSTGATNVGFEKLTIQCASTETANMTRWVSGLTGATDFTISKTATLTTGRIKTAVLFTDDPATLANAKLLGFDITLITPGQTRTLSVTDASGTIATDKNVVIDNLGDVVTHNGELVLS